MIRALAPFVAISVAMLASSAFAADAALPETPPVLPPESGWTFTVAPYFWMAGINGTVGQFGAAARRRRRVLHRRAGEFRHRRDGGGRSPQRPLRRRLRFQYVRLSAAADTPFGLAEQVEVTSQTFTSLAAVEYRVCRDRHRKRRPDGRRPAVVGRHRYRSAGRARRPAVLLRWRHLGRSDHRRQRPA